MRHIFIFSLFFGSISCVFSSSNIVDSVNYYGQGYSQKMGNIYYYGSLVDGTDISSFETVGRIYAKDNNGVYFKDKIIPGADPHSFQSLGMKPGFEIFAREDLKIYSIGYAYDNKNYYAQGENVGFVEIKNAKDYVERMQNKKKSEFIRFMAIFGPLYFIPIFLFYFKLKEASINRKGLKTILVGLLYAGILYAGIILLAHGAIRV